MGEQLKDDDWKNAADRAYAAASAEADIHGLTVFLEVFDDGCKRWESRGTPPPEDGEVASLKARVAELEGRKLYVAHVGEDMLGVFSSRERAVAALAKSPAWQRLQIQEARYEQQMTGSTAPRPPFYDIDEVTLDVPDP